MHGGAKGSGGPSGERNGNYKSGLWTGAATASGAAMSSSSDIRVSQREIAELARRGYAVEPGAVTLDSVVESFISDMLAEPQ
jgi:hypothetical protein